MATRNTKFIISAFTLPMGLLFLPLICTADHDSGHLASAVAGWMLLLLAAQSLTTVVAGALCRNVQSCCLAGIISGTAAMLAQSAGCAAGLIPPGAILPAAAVFVGWGMFCAALAAFLCFWNRRAAIPVGVMITTALIFSPVIFTPLFLALPSESLHSNAVTEILINISPAIWMINALAAHIHYNWFIWFHAPLMYQHVVPGQNTLMPKLWPWWLLCSAAALAGILLAAAAGRAYGKCPRHGDET